MSCAATGDVTLTSNAPAAHRTCAAASPACRRFDRSRVMPDSLQDIANLQQDLRERQTAF
jgi:hypothetical protein